MTGAAPVALVTQATLYAGPGAVTALRRAGYRVVCQDDGFVDEQRRAEFAAAHPGVLASPHKSPYRAVSSALREYGRLDLVVSNDVYPAKYQPVTELDPAELRPAAEALLVTPAALVAKVAAVMRRQGCGHIVLITSAAPERPEPGFSVYSSLRAGASAFARAAARELAPHGITVHAIAPNFLASEQYYPHARWGTAEGRAELREMLPAGRLGTAEEIGELIVFLAGGSADFTTGEVIRFTGGWP